MKYFHDVTVYSVLFHRLGERTAAEFVRGTLSGDEDATVTAVS